MLYLPLFKHPELMFDLRLLFSAIVSLWLLFKQKSLDIKQIIERAKDDGYSTIFIVLCGMITQSISIYEWSNHGSLASKVSLPIIIGNLMLFGGLYLRILAIETLDKYFTNEVYIGQEWQLIKHGIYKYLRHPSYTGSLISMLGTPVLFESYSSLWVSSIILSIVYIYRITLEEKALIKFFGQRYQDYKQQTSAILPFLY